jgi:hypothetical protein
MPRSMEILPCLVNGAAALRGKGQGNGKGTDKNHEK